MCLIYQEKIGSAQRRREKELSHLFFTAVFCTPLIWTRKRYVRCQKICVCAKLRLLVLFKQQVSSVKLIALQCMSQNSQGSSSKRNVEIVKIDGITIISLPAYLVSQEYSYVRVQWWIQGCSNCTVLWK